jgi:spermidine/putrescine transport system substrate-binding protein
MLLAAASAPAEPETRADTLRLYNWENYLDPGLAAEFTRRTGVHIHQSYFTSDWERDLRIVSNGAADFDLIVLDATQVSAYATRGWLAPVGVERVPALAHYDARWLLPKDAAGYALPYAWGVIGIVYRADLIGQAPDSWSVLFHPPRTLCGKLLMGDDARELSAVALKAGGFSGNSTRVADHRAAERALRGQRPCVGQYRYPGTLPESPLLSGTAVAGMSYSTDAAWLHARNPQVRFAIPKEGGLMWVDYLVVVQTSPRKRLAYEFLKFLAEPSVAARQAAYLRAGNPAIKLSAARATKDDGVDADAGRFEASEMILPMPPAIVSLRNQIFATIKRAD